MGGPIEAVIAVPDEGYRFIEWSCGDRTPNLLGKLFFIMIVK